LPAIVQPNFFATVDQFAVKALRREPEYPVRVQTMNEVGPSASDAVLLI
jgi:hypothetical protein